MIDTELAAPILDHVAIGVPDAAAVLPFLVGELGGRRLAAGPGVGFRFWQWSFEDGGTIEIIQPDGPPDGFLHRFLAARGPGVHHITFKVPDLEKAMAHATSLGYEIVGFNDEWPDWKEAFLHPKQAQGIVVQLAETHPELDAQPPGEWPFPPEPENPPPAVRIDALRLVAGSADRARHQWEATLGGSCTANGAELVFRWRASPLRVVVTIEPGADEGPRAIEVATDRSLALPEGPHPLLGTAFTFAR
jgi:catechol 2,3-dioxygenase-like lactoylglutathione lyase family enzyme